MSAFRYLSFIVSTATVFCLSSVCEFVKANDEPHEEIIVKSHPLSKGGSTQSLSVLQGDELAQKVQGTLGETISREPGIRSANFGTAVGRPVIRGLGGARVKTTEDRIDSLDVSVVSTDHAVTVEPFIANRITVLKGASTLIYGTAAIGGVVDVETGRIANSRPESPFSGRVEMRVADNADATVGAVRLDGQAGDNLVWHVDAFSKDADEYEIPGFAESEILRASEGELGEEGEEVEGILEGSFSESEGGAIGLSFVNDSGFVGFSLSTTEAQYGLIGGHGHEEEEEHDEEHEEEEHEHEEEEEGIGMIDMEQTRFDIEAQLNTPFDGIESIGLRVGINDYEHSEIEGNGEVGTLFENDAWEGRLELVHEEIAGFEGTFGLQLSRREFSALGEEAFVPPVETDTQGAFWVAQRNYGDFEVEAGVRFEEVEHTSSLDAAQDRRFTTNSASLGFISSLSESLTFSALVDYSTRAPAIEELYSNGPHLATQSFEIGDLNLQEESGTSFTVSMNYLSDHIDVIGSVYHMRFDDFIYQAGTGEIDDDLPVFVYQQDDSRFTGLDLEIGLHLMRSANGDLDLTAMFDTVSAEIDVQGNDNLPRIPATRYGVGLKWSDDSWSASLDLVRVEDQRDVADFELATKGYDDISFRVNRRVDLQDWSIDLFLHGRNLGDDEQREHASFVKDVAPAPGRRVEAGIRFQF